MKNKPGYSMGPYAPFNFMRSSKGWILFDTRNNEVVFKSSKRKGFYAKHDCSQQARIFNKGYIVKEVLKGEDENKVEFIPNGEIPLDEIDSIG